MSRSRLLLSPLFASLVAFLATEALATTMVPRSVEDLARASQSIVRATTLSSHSTWDASHRVIITTVRLRALEKIAGNIEAAAEFEVEQMGGIADGIEMTVIGAPSFEAGQEVVLFLQPDAQGHLGVVDLAQGKLEVSRDASGRDRVTRRDLAAVEWAGGNGPDRIADLATLRTRVASALHNAH